MKYFYMMVKTHYTSLLHNSIFRHRKHPCKDRFRQIYATDFTIRIYYNGKNWPYIMQLENQRSRWWYLLPIFLAIVGGVIAYFVLRHDDPGKAKNCLFLGIILTILQISLSMIEGAIPYLWYVSHRTDNFQIPKLSEYEKC